MVRLLSDENFHGNIIRGLFLLRPQIDLLRVQDVGLEGVEDPTILEWAAVEDRIVLTRDKATMPDYAYDRVKIGENMPGMFVVNQQLPIREAIDEVLLIDEACEHSEWAGLVIFLPL